MTNAATMTETTKGPTKAGAIAFRVANIESTRRARWNAEFETRSEFEAGNRPVIRLNTREIEALETLPDDAMPVEVWRALMACAASSEFSWASHAFYCGQVTALEIARAEAWGLIAER